MSFDLVLSISPQQLATTYCKFAVHQFWILCSDN